MISKTSIYSTQPIGDYYISNFRFLINNNCTTVKIHNYCGEGDHFFFWLLIPTAVHTLAYHLVFMTALEFISAQAPLRMKGSLITIWYAMSAQQYFVQAVTVVIATEDKTWMITRGVQAFFILLSLLVYCCVSKRYRYRLRDEVVNEHYLVEEVYDRELRLAEEYEREKRAEMRELYGCPVVRRTTYGSTGACSEQSTED